MGRWLHLNKRSLHVGGRTLHVQPVCCQEPPRLSLLLARQDEGRRPPQSKGKLSQLVSADVRVKGKGSRGGGGSREHVLVEGSPRGRLASVLGPEEPGGGTHLA